MVPAYLTTLCSLRKIFFIDATLTPMRIAPVPKMAMLMPAGTSNEFITVPVPVYRPQPFSSVLSPLYQIPRSFLSVLVVLTRNIMYGTCLFDVFYFTSQL